MAEILHAGALAATVLSTCCIAAGRRPRVRDLLLAVAMLAAMVDVVVGAGIVSPLWWALLLLVLSLWVIAVPRGRAGLTGAVRATRAMDALGGVMMAALLMLMSAGRTGAEPTTAPVAHAGHGAGAGTVVVLVVLAALVFGVTAVGMGVATRPHGSTAPRPGARSRTSGRELVARTASISMGGSVALMALVAVL